VRNDTRKDGGEFRKRHAAPQNFLAACYLTHQHAHNPLGQKPCQFSGVAQDTEVFE
jgi:hypothetical protein